MKSFQKRGVVLFLIGSGLSLVLNIMQNKNSSMKSEDVNIILSKWWLLLISGIVSVFIGLIYPCFKSCQESQPLSQEWPHVLRCIAIFVGINEACTKIDFPSNLHLTLSLAVLSTCLWWNFDRTKLGFAMGLAIASITIIVTQILVHYKVCIYTEKEFLHMKSWLPCVAFSGGITVGNIGMQLAINDTKDVEKKPHTE